MTSGTPWSRPGTRTRSGGATFNRFATVAVFRGQDLGRCDIAHNQVRVVMVKADDGALAEHPFYIWFEKAP
jgi:hypothetical protein